MRRKDDPGELTIDGGTFSLILFNSFFLFLIAYLFIYLLNLFITGFTAVVYNIPVVLYYHDVDYLIRGTDWTSDSVAGVFSSGPLFMLVLSVFLLILYTAVITETGILRLLLLWMIYHALTRIFGEILVGAFMGKGFGYVILYLFVMDTGKLILTIFGFVAMFLIGLFIARPVLFSANIYFNDLQKPFRMQFIFCQFIIPYLLGNIAIFLVKLPEINKFDIALNATMILFFIPLLIRGANFRNLYFDEDPRNLKVKLILPAAAVILLALFRILFGIGIRL
jgi:hypothetical protein